MISKLEESFKRMAAFTADFFQFSLLPIFLILSSILEIFALSAKKRFSPKFFARAIENEDIKEN